jgi:hypothetical protein
MYERFYGHRMGQFPEAASRCSKPKSEWLAICERELVFWLLENPRPRKATECATTEHGEIFKLKRLCADGERTLFKKFLSASRDGHLK